LFANVSDEAFGNISGCVSFFGGRTRSSAGLTKPSEFFLVQVSDLQEFFQTRFWGRFKKNPRREFLTRARARGFGFSVWLSQNHSRDCKRLEEEVPPKVGGVI
jgi:hypothetical protein